MEFWIMRYDQFYAVTIRGKFMILSDRFDNLERRSENSNDNSEALLMWVFICSTYRHQGFADIPGEE